MRGFNQAEIFAEEIVKNFGWLSDSGLLFKSKITLSQTKLNRIERDENMQGAFELNGKVDSKKLYVLVDDVITSGATMREAVKVLKNAGVRHVWAITVVHG